MSEHEKVTKDIIPHAQMVSMYIGQWRRVEKEYIEALELLKKCRDVLPSAGEDYGSVKELQDKLDKFLG